MSVIEHEHIDPADLPKYIATGEIALGDALFRAKGLDPDPTAEIDRMLSEKYERVTVSSGALAVRTTVR